jgi:hypothetical protein
MTSDHDHNKTGIEMGVRWRGPPFHGVLAVLELVGEAGSPGSEVDGTPVWFQRDPIQSSLGPSVHFRYGLHVRGWIPIQPDVLEDLLLGADLRWLEYD